MSEQRLGSGIGTFPIDNLANHLLRPNYANLLPTFAMKCPKLPVLLRVSLIMENGLPLIVLKSNSRLKFRLNGRNGPKLASF